MVPSAFDICTLGDGLEVFARSRLGGAATVLGRAPYRRWEVMPLVVCGIPFVGSLGRGGQPFLVRALRHGLLHMNMY